MSLSIRFGILGSFSWSLSKPNGLDNFIRLMIIFELVLALDENIISYFECFYYLSTWSITTKFHCKINISHYDKSFEKLKKSSTSLGKNILTDLSEKLIIILTS